MLSHVPLFSSIDRARLFAIGDAQSVSSPYPSAQVRGLNRHLNRGRFVEPESMPADVITMHSRLRVTMEGDVESREITIVFPEDASHPDGRVSILKPMAQALLGARVGDVVVWQAPAGAMSARVEELLYQPEAALGSA